MKLEELRKFLIIEKYLKEWTGRYPAEWTINSDGTVDVEGSVVPDNFHGSKLPFKFRIVTKRFDLSLCRSITSLENCPYEVGEFFSCSNNPITSLEFAPKKTEHFDINNYNVPVRFTEADIRKICEADNIYCGSGNKYQDWKPTIKI